MPELPGPGTVDPAVARLESVRFVLVEPQHGGNVGAAARALKNLGFRRLCLVAPQCDPTGVEARRMAKDARDVLHGATVHDDLDAALDGATAVVGTSRRTGRYRRPHVRLDRFEDELGTIVAAGEVAAVFGREAHGLSDAELDRCTHLVYFPASDDYPSFNLAQSVLLVAYEARLALDTSPAADVLDPPADHAAREAMYDHLQRALRTIGFVHDETAESIMRKIRRMLGRARLTDEETQIVRGIARQTLWASARAGLVPPGDGDD